MNDGALFAQGDRAKRNSAVIIIIFQVVEQMHTIGRCEEDRPIAVFMPASGYV